MLVVLQSARRKPPTSPLLLDVSGWCRNNRHPTMATRPARLRCIATVLKTETRRRIRTKEVTQGPIGPSDLRFPVGGLSFRSRSSRCRDFKASSTKSLIPVLFEHLQRAIADERLASQHSSPSTNSGEGALQRLQRTCS